MAEPTYEDWKNAMARFVSYRMRAMGITLEDLAGRSGLAFDYLRRVVEGTIYPSHKARQLMEPALGCSLEHVEPHQSKHW